LPDDSVDEEELAKALKGKTLQVYWYMLRHPEPMTAREIQRGTGLSSPSLSMHHLERLRTLGLVDKNVHGEYSVRRDVRVGVLKLFVGRGRLMVPRFLFYATFFSSITAALLTVIILTWSIAEWVAATFVSLEILSCLILWAEAFRIWREQPFPEGEP